MTGIWQLDRLLRQAKLKHADACLEDVHTGPGRGLEKRLVASLAGGDWIRQGQGVLLTGPTGVGKTWLACALGQQACPELVEGPADRASRCSTSACRD